MSIQRLIKNTFKLWLIKHKTVIFKWSIVYLILLGALVTQVKLIHLTSESLPYEFCLQFHNIRPKKGDLCVFNFEPRVKSKDGKKISLTFVKYLVGESGDEVNRIENSIYVNSKLVGKIKKVKGLNPVESSVIPKGYVFVAGTHEDSLDSRYKEFGFIKKSDIKGRAIGCIRR